ncbi:Hypothetical_protein [Hexamita inflata]|uniref:Hypothetical_protein n=1 Tax=Hexamita inflata TaxID=28002 RepID=A0ABP1GFG0_9EUKA
MITQLTITVNQTTSLLKNQVEGTKGDIRTIQNQITGIHTIINNITSVNTIQSQDIQALKNQQSPIMNGVLWCTMAKGVFPKVTGYCTKSKQCCYQGMEAFFGTKKFCMVQVSDGSLDYNLITEAVCGQFVLI